jgi:TPR repeat protein
MGKGARCVLRAMSLSVIFTSAAGCGAGAAGEAVRPKARTASDALGGGGAACTGSASRALTPLVVDLSGADRLDFEAQMRGGIAIVQATCEGMHILPGCTVAGEYSFVGVTAKEETVELKSGDELAANIPFSGGKIGGGLARDQSLDLAMLLVGKRTTPLGVIYREELVGACEGATHSVRAATIGAFAMQTATSGHVQAAAAMFGMGASGSSDSAENKAHKDGDPAACKTADPSSPNPPAQCAALLRLELMPIQPGKAPDRSKPATAQAQPVTSTCPAGFAMQAGKCTQDVGGAPHLCNPSNFDDCVAQCDAGDADSCFNAASTSQYVGLANRQDEFFKKACDHGSAAGCRGLAQGLASSDSARALDLLRKACGDGYGAACMDLGSAQIPIPVDEQVGALKRACLLGEALACQTSAAYLMKTDVPAAQEMLEKSCMASNAESCVSAATLYFGDAVNGVTGKKDEVKGVKVATQGCRLHVAGLCLSAVQRIPPQTPQRADLLRTGCFDGEVQGESDLDDVQQACSKLPTESWSAEDERRAAGAMCARSGGAEICAAFERLSLERTLELERQACDVAKDAGACADLPQRQEELWCLKHVVAGVGGKAGEGACAALRQADPAKLRHIYQLQCNVASSDRAAKLPAPAAAPHKPAHEAAGSPPRKPGKAPAEPLPATPRASAPPADAGNAACVELRRLGG